MFIKHIRSAHIVTLLVSCLLLVGFHKTSHNSPASQNSVKNITWNKATKPKQTVQPKESEPAPAAANASDQAQIPAAITPSPVTQPSAQPAPHPPRQYTPAAGAFQVTSVSLDLVQHKCYTTYDGLSVDTYTINGFHGSLPLNNPAGTVTWNLETTPYISAVPTASRQLTVTAGIPYVGTPGGSPDPIVSINNYSNPGLQPFSVRIHITSPNDITSNWVNVPAMIDHSQACQ